MSINITKKDLLWSYLGYILNTCTNIILLPVILHFLSQKELGLWYTFSSVGNLAILLDFGFLPTIMRNITYCWSGATEIKKEGLAISSDTSEPNFKLLNMVIITSRRIYLIISILALLFLVTFGSLYIKYISKDLSGWRYMISWLIYCLAIFLNIYYSYWGPFLRGIGAIKESQKAIIISRLVQLFLSVTGLLLGYGIISISIGYLISGIIMRQVSKFYFYNFSNMKQRLYEVNLDSCNYNFVHQTFKIIWHNAWRLGLVSLGAFLITQANIMICSAYLGLNVTASYGLTIQLFGIASSFSGIMFNSYLAVLNEARLKKNIVKIRKVFSISVVISWLCYSFIGSIIVLIGNKAVILIGSKTELLPRLMMVYMGIYLFLEFNHSMAATFITTSNEVPFVRASLLSGIAIIVCSFISIKFTTLGLWGLLLSQSLIQLIYNNWYWPYRVLKELNMNIFDIIKNAYEVVSNRFNYSLIKNRFL